MGISSNFASNSICAQLLREENEFSHEKVDTLCMKDFPHSINHLGKRIGPFKVGHPYPLDHYVAKILVKKGYLRFDDEKLLNRKSIQKINFQESTNPELGKIEDHSYVYTQAHEQLKIINEMYEQGKAPRQDFKQFYSDLNDLIRVRLAKINRLATQPQNVQSKKVLTSEEIILFDEISKNINEWREHLGKVKSSFKS
ncbi:hypothetical protein NEF87_002891 [Candidatus Lokiarchaeum ossiferum]|uniref:GINS subunit domain-containing protein n=1 Tax=Candidatus Lokiarchaeum ossiferum TaxID=2951803 RepID=A0ABY6HVI5_9ARCH|nr:hypothetical protein NEF87_002891 [Candidatus Lokiarchaeum sp. B-35]